MQFSNGGKLIVIANNPIQHSKFRIPLPAALITLLIAATSAMAAPSPSTIDARVDRRVERQITIRPADRAVHADTPFTFSATVPFTLNSDPSQDGSHQSSWHTDPELTLDWAKQLGTLPIFLVAHLDADADRYARDGSNDSDTAYSFVNAYLTDGRDKYAWVPYAGYRLMIGFQPTFSDWQYSFNEFYGGLRKDFPTFLNRIEIRGGRRGSTFTSSYYAFAKAIFALPLDSIAGWSINFAPQLLMRWFDEQSGTRRRDSTAIAVLYLAYVPTHSAIPGSPEIDLSVTYTNNSSNVDTAEFDVWDVGPSITVSWTF